MSKTKFFAILAMLCLCQSSAVGQLRINEFLASNSASAFDPDFGVFADFVEIQNTSSDTISLNNFSLTDNPENKKKWIFPNLQLAPGQFLVLWADGIDKNMGEIAFSEFKGGNITTTALHLSYKLSADGEYLGLFNPDGQVVDESKFGVQENDVSFGRNPANPSEWLFFSEVTPGTANSNFGANSLDFALDPEFNIAGGFYPSAQSLQISTTEENAVIRFTFDGSTPGRNSAVFLASFNVFRNYIVKARAYVPGKLPSSVVTMSYFIGENIHLPVLSISSNSNHLFGFDFGIIRNSIKDREVPGTVEYYDENKNLGFSTGVGLRIFGTTIYTLPQKPISLRFKPKFGDDELQYKLFNERENQRFKSVQLRNGGNDYNFAYFRDGLSTNLLKGKMDLDYQEYKPCVVFINGDYQGIYEIRERLDAQYLADNNVISTENIDLIEDSLTVVAGDEKEFQQLIRLLSTLDLSDDENFNIISSKVDVDEYINYMIHKIFIGYSIVDYNNKYWRSKDKSSKWRWIAHDMEHAFGEISGDKYWENTLDKVSGNEPLLPEWSTLIFKNMLKNTAFRDQLIQRFAVYLQTIYRPEITIDVLDSVKSVFAPQMPRHILRWNSPINLQVWNRNVDTLQNYLTQRPSFIREHITSIFPVEDSAKITLKIVGNGNIAVSGVLISDTLFSGYFFKNAKLQLKAVPAPGQRFVGWQGVSTDEWLNFDVLNDTAFTALFETLPISIIPPLVDKDTVLSAALSPWYALEDIVVQNGATLSIEAGVQVYVSDKASFYVDGGLMVQGNEMQKVSIQPNPFTWGRIPAYNTSPRWGVIVAQNADTIHFQHAKISGSGFGKNRRKQFSSISAFDSPVHISYTEITDNLQPFYSEGGSIYIGHSTFRSENTCDLINVKYSANPIVEFCDLEGNRAYDTDAIDYDGVTGGVIRYNKIYGFLGDNSDGLDLGEDAKNVLIEYNIISNCTDKGISIGQASTAIIRRNLIFDCAMGIALKDEGSFALIDQNSLYSNGIGVSAYEKNTSRGGAVAMVSNSILSQSIFNTLEIDDKSSIEVRYSLSDKELLSGTGNITGDPLFEQPSTANFQLQNSSPCIDSGDPNSPQDPDGTPADMGAYYTHAGVRQPDIIISEVNFQSAINYDSGDWIELYNTSDSVVNLNGWKIAHGFNSYTFDGDLLLQPGDYSVICQERERFLSKHPEVTNAIGNTNLDLALSGNISLYRADDALAYRFTYNSSLPWPSIANGKGATLEMDREDEENTLPPWRESYVLMGTPGRKNSTAPDLERIFVNELMATNSNSFADEYGDFDDWFEIYNDNDFPVNIGGLYFSDKDSEPQRWQAPLHYPEQTTLPAKGFLVIWADGQPKQGALHADFSLSASGERILISQRLLPGFRRIERLEFGAQTEGITYGRYPDGSDSLSLMSPTPNSSNMLMTFIDEKTLSTVLVYPNPFSTHIVFDTRNIPSPYSLSIFDLMGKEVLGIQKIAEQRFTMPRGQLSKGIYIYNITGPNGERATGKIVAY